MLYDKIRAQDPYSAGHPAFPVWEYGFMWRCEGDTWESVYDNLYTPGGELFDVGSIDIYPYSLWGEDPIGPPGGLHHWINHSYSFPNGDGFGELGKGMIPVIQAFVGGNGIMPDIVAQYNCIHFLT